MSINLICPSIFLLAYMVALASGQEDELDPLHTLLSLALKEQQIKHTHRKYMSKFKPCREISDKNATFVKAVGRFSNKLVEVDPLFSYDISFCNIERAQECAKDSLCQTIYRWLPSRTRPITEEFNDDSTESEYTMDDILVPSGCMCVIGAKYKNVAPHPIIIIIE